MVPLDLSYDHRIIINGADAALFADPRRMLIRAAPQIGEKNGPDPLKTNKQI
jgi:pyruvate/2-oxoglutarate dehydrogenase complex dihydrolipoamide acyltransferase (E2) component